MRHSHAGTGLLARSGGHTGIRTNIADYGLSDALPCSPEGMEALAGLATRLKRMEPALQERLINWGYAVCDAALRRHVDPTIPRGQFPYANADV